MAGIPALFLDRDGVLIENAHYLACLSDVWLIPGAAAAIRRLNLAGVPVVVVSNQSGVARGYFSESFIRETHAYLDDLLAREGARIDAWYYCPHHPDFGPDCDCRKPKPGMLHVAARERNLDLARSWLIGDNLTDLQAGEAAGCRTILVRTGHGPTMPLPDDWTTLNLQAIADALPEAVEFFFQKHKLQRAA